ncbi:MAG: metallophosphoesterase family protein [Peptococcia bacterium]
MTEYKIGVISDTHGLLREEAIKALQGSDLIIHAGDIGRQHILEALNQIATVIAVRGNNDFYSWAWEIPTTQYLEFAGLNIFVLHDLYQMNLDAQVAGIDLVIYGHTHRPKESHKNGVHYLNPGSAGPRRFNLPISLARLKVRDGNIVTEFITL